MADLAPLPSPTPPDPVQWYDWGEAPAVRVVQGRVRELAELSGWVRDDRCRVVEILGAGGIGKTTPAGRLARDLAPEFAVAYWRSLRNALPVEEWLDGAIGALSAGKAIVPDGFDARLGLLLQLARTHRALRWRPARTVISWLPGRWGARCAYGAWPIVRP